MNEQLDLADLAAELCDSRQHIERIPYWDVNRNRKHKEHRVILPGLLQQMADLFTASTADGGSSAAVSKPPARWDALADHTQITIAAVKWCWDLRLDQRDTVEGNIRQLVGAAGGLDSDTRHRLLADMGRWHRWAQIVTGWRTPPTDLKAPCPAYDEERDRECARRTLRVNYAAKEAYCGSCGTRWDHTTIGLLAESVRAYERKARADADEARKRDRAERQRREGKIPAA